ncbi:hypothetical protein [Streptomyces luteolus]|uniref:Transposase n=1 Tax=Streptomyces luteolus TaxID=3043615 RepID=A0ABT6T488_9ACTN|nr:hypothetical protein [Streptomyces sp. B-S-A12]MDI3422683.1 hypothetical protein [Streptomyces sp. B-S-A12]
MCEHQTATIALVTQLDPEMVVELPLTVVRVVLVERSRCGSKAVMVAV